VWEEFCPPQVLGGFFTARRIALEIEVQLQGRNDGNPIELFELEEHAFIPRCEYVHVAPVSTDFSPMPSASSAGSPASIPGCGCSASSVRHAMHQRCR